MSGNRRKNTPPKPVDAAEDPAASRLVVLAKTPEQNGAKADTKQKPRQERIGDLLRQARLDRADDLYHIAEYLCIKPAFLVALENSNYDEFPADAYVIGFLRTYANFLGIDGKEAIDRYRYEMAGRRKKPVLSMPNPLSEGRAPSALIMVGATIAALLLYALWYGISSANRTQTHAQPTVPIASTNTDTDAAAGLSAPVPPPAAAVAPLAATTVPTPPPAPAAATVTPQPPATPATTVATPTATAVTTSVPTTAPEGIVVTAPKADVPPQPDKNAKKRATNEADTSSRLVIRATQSSWVMVTDSSGKAIFDHVMKNGDTYKVPNTAGLSLTTGNGGGIILSLDGADLPKVASGAPHIVRDIPLDPDHLTAGSTSTAH